MRERERERRREVVGEREGRKEKRTKTKSLARFWPKDDSVEGRGPFLSLPLLKIRKSKKRGSLRHLTCLVLGEEGREQTAG